MGDDRTQDQSDKPAYEPPAVAPLGSANDLAKGNEGSQTDSTTTVAS